MNIWRKIMVMYAHNYEFLRAWLVESYGIPDSVEVTPKLLIHWRMPGGQNIPFDIVQDWAYARVGLILGQGLVYQIGDLTILNYRSMN